MSSGGSGCSCMVNCPSAQIGALTGTGSRARSPSGLGPAAHSPEQHAPRHWSPAAGCEESGAQAHDYWLFPLTCKDLRASMQQHASGVASTSPCSQSSSSTRKPAGRSTAQQPQQWLHLATTQSLPAAPPALRRPPPAPAAGRAAPDQARARTAGTPGSRAARS